MASFGFFEQAFREPMQVTHIGSILTLHNSSLLATSSEKHG